MEFKFNKKQAVNRTKQAGGIAVGVLAGRVLQNKFAHLLGKYNQPDYIDGIKAVTGVAIAGSVTRKDDLSGAVQDAGIGIAADGIISFAGRKLASALNKVSKPVGVHTSKPPVSKMNSPVRIIPMNNPTGYAPVAQRNEMSIAAAMV